MKMVTLHIDQDDNDEFDLMISEILRLDRSFSKYINKETCRITLKNGQRIRVKEKKEEVRRLIEGCCV